MLISRVLNNKLYLSLLFAGSVILTACETPEETAENHFEKGKELFEKGEYDKAILELKTSSQNSVNRSDTYYYMALLDEKGGNYKSMRENLEKTVELDPNNVDARQKLGKVHLVFGDLDKALEQADFLLKNDPKNQEAQLLKASVVFRQGKKDQATQLIDDVLAVSADNIDALSLKAAIYFEEKKFDQALTISEKVLEKDLKNLPIRLFRIKVYGSENNIDGVMDEYKKLVELYPDNDSFKLRLASLYSMTDKLQPAEELLRVEVDNKQDKVEPKIVLLEFLNAKRKDGVVKEFDTMLESSSKNPSSMLELSKWMLGAGYLKEGSRGLVRVVDSEKDNKTGLAAQTILAELALKNKEYDKVEESINHILQVNSDFVDASLLKARLFLIKNEVDKSIDVLNNVVWTKNDSDKAYMLLGQAYTLKKDLKQADKYFKQALEVNPVNLQAFLPVYSSYLKANQKDTARQFLDKALKARPNEMLLLSMKAELDISEKKWSDAQETVQRLSLFSKNKLLPLYLQANVLQGTKKYEEAVKIYEKILADQPGHLNSLVNLVRSYEALKQRDKAISFLETHHAKHKEDLTTVGILADLYVADNEYPKAKQLLMNQIKLSPDKSAALYLALAKVEAKSEKSVDAAKEVYLKGLQANPDNLPLSLALAGLYEQIGQKDAAQKTYERIIQKYPDANLAINNLAAILIDSDIPEQTAKGLALAERFKDVDNVFMRDTYAWGLVKNGKNSDGLAILESLIVKEPKIPELRYHLGVAHLNNGNKATAIIEIKQAIALADQQHRSFSNKDEAMKLLKELEH
ncbi:tetratricopeptide repeat protein [Methylomonas sp. MgM2]